MSTSRKISDLVPEAREKALQVEEACARLGSPILVYCTLRSVKAQAKLFREGRSLEKIMEKHEELASEWKRPDLAQVLLDVGPQYGKYIKTKAGPGQSYHNYARAFDAVPLRNGECVWGDKEPEDSALWEVYGDVCRSNGLKWGGDWRWPDKPHSQLLGIDWRELISIVTLPGT